MKYNKCDIVKDLLPLYVEELTSDESKRYVENHLENCDDCSIQLEYLIAEIEKPNIINKQQEDSLLLFKANFLKNKKTGILLILSILLFIISVTTIYLFEPIYLTNAHSYQVVQLNHDQIDIQIPQPYSHYHFYVEESDIEHNYVFVFAYTTIWDQIMQTPTDQTLSLHPTSDKISNIYLVQHGGANDVLVYPTDTPPSGGGAILPRLIFNYYFVTALILIPLLSLITFILRKRKRIYTICKYILCIPTSYFIAHIFVFKGFHSITTYASEYYVCSIFILSLVTYTMILLFLRYRKLNKNL